jgi:hypothetical protein
VPPDFVRVQILVSVSDDGRYVASAYTGANDNALRSENSDWLGYSSPITHHRIELDLPKE